MSGDSGVADPPWIYCCRTGGHLRTSEHRRQYRRRIQGGHRRQLAVELLGDAGIEQLGAPRAVDQDVRRFEIAMDHQVRVRRLDHGADTLNVG